MARICSVASQSSSKLHSLLGQWGGGENTVSSSPLLNRNVLTNHVDCPVYVRAWMHADIFVGMCDGQMSTLGVILQDLSTLFFETESLIGTT